jgi:serine O-acetyltransferase
MESNYTEILSRNIDILSDGELPEFQYIPQHLTPLPSVPALKRVVELLRIIIFPGYFGDSIVNQRSLRCHIGVMLENVYQLLSEQIFYGLQFDSSLYPEEDQQEIASEKALAFIDKLPELKRLLSCDVKETFDGDPAAKSYGEVIFSYPTIRAVFSHRIAHGLLKLGVPVLPRIISELAHSETGIDVHPAAQIGEYFSIDHGTGVVIGETTIIGNHVRLYQGVTLGAKRFSLGEDGLPVNVPRHPVVEDNVVIYANANVLGRITIGKNTVIGGNVWLTHSVPPGSRILQQKVITGDFYDGLGI